MRLSDRIGKVVTYTFDFFFPAPDPPTIVTITEIDGARVHLQIVNAKPEEVKLGLPVEFEFRQIHEVGGRPNYFWKGTPVPDEEIGMRTDAIRDKVAIVGVGCCKFGENWDKAPRT